MSDLSVRAKTLADEATPGPWEWRGRGWDRDDINLVADLPPKPDKRTKSGLRSQETDILSASGGWDGEGFLNYSEEDAAFIAESRELVPALAAEVERLEARCDFYVNALRGEVSQKPPLEQAIVDSLLRSRGYGTPTRADSVARAVRDYLAEHEDERVQAMRAEEDAGDMRSRLRRADAAVGLRGSSGE